LCAEASNFQAVEKSLQSGVAALKGRNNLLGIEKSGLDVTVADLAASVKIKEQEVADLDAVVTSVKSCLDDGDVWRVMVDEFALLKFFASVCGMEHEQLFTEFNGGAARQMSLSMEVRMRTKYNIREMRRLNSIVE
nr:hypothetical protein [Tanacetum cinerariifolium]